MIIRILITKKLEPFFIKTNPESFFKAFVISFLFDKNFCNKIEALKNLNAFEICNI